MLIPFPSICLFLTIYELFVSLMIYNHSQVNHLAPFGLIDTHQNMIVLTTYQMAKSMAQLNNELACNGSIII